MHNAVKHAEAAHIKITLVHVNNKLSIKIEDDGKGIPAEAFKTGGMGLHIMQYRCNIINDRLRITQGNQRGTLVLCSLDYEEILDSP